MEVGANAALKALSQNGPENAASGRVRNATITLTRTLETRRFPVFSNRCRSGANATHFNIVGLTLRTR